jgi:pyruvate dehydrogenase E1 component alpha subunit
LAENPLLPHRKLKELHALILRCHALDRTYKGKTKSPAREALLAASAIHLEPGDLIFAEANDPVAASLAPAPKPRSRKASKKAVATAEFQLPRLAAAAAAAHSLGPKSKNLVLAHTHENASETNWQATLRFAQANHLPLLLLCAGVHPHPRLRTAQKNDRTAFTWDSVSRLCARLKIPLLPVDGEDAVALFRVFQESTLHARAGAARRLLLYALQPIAKLAASNYKPNAYGTAQTLGYSSVTLQRIWNRYT